jgi:hypothetical protein
MQARTARGAGRPATVTRLVLPRSAENKRPKAIRQPNPRRRRATLTSSRTGPQTPKIPRLLLFATERFCARSLKFEYFSGAHAAGTALPRRTQNQTIRSEANWSFVFNEDSKRKLIPACYR